jgi:hypothetical protein
MERRTDMHHGGLAGHQKLRRASFLLRYAILDWASRWTHVARQLALSSVLLAVFFLVLGFVPAAEFATLAAQEHAGYDFRVNGPLATADLRTIQSLPLVGGAVPLTAVVPSELATDHGSTHNVVVYLCFEPSMQWITWFSPALLLEGRPLSAEAESEAVIDTAAADALGASIGEIVRFEVEPGASTKVIAQARVVGIYASSSPLNGAILLGPSAEARSIARMLAVRADRNGLLFSDVMVAAAPDTDAAELGAALSDLFQGNRDVLIESRTSVLEHLRDVNQSVLGTAWPVVLPPAVLVLYVLGLLKDAAQRLRLRRREVATLIALGASEGLGMGLIVAEIVAESLLASAAAIPLARWSLSAVIHAFVPASAWFRMLGGVAAATAIGSITGSLWTWRILHRHPLARLIGEETVA